MSNFTVVCNDTSKLLREDWLALRRQGIGSSDAAACLGQSPWTSAYGLWAEKRGLLPEVPDSDRFWWGRALEPIIIARWSEQFRRPIPKRNVMLRSNEHPFMLDNPDGIISGAVVEVKTADPWDEPRWDIGVPDHYALQGAHHCVVVGVRRCYFPVLFGFHLREFVIDYPESILTHLVSAEQEMWRRIVEDDAPDPDGTEVTTAAIRAQFYESNPGRAIDLPAEADALIKEREGLAALGEEYTRSANQIKNQLMLLLRNAEIGLIDGNVALTWKADKNGQRSLRFPPNRREFKA